MPAIQRTEFALALNQVSAERGIDPAIVLDTVKNAILAAYRKDHPDIVVEEYSATLDANTGEAHILHKDKDVTPPGFGRIAAQTAKQVILQKIREKEKEAIMSDYRLKIGTITNGMVLRFMGPNVIVDIGKTEGIMPPNEQIQNERYRLNQRIVVYISEIKEGLKGEEIYVSRANSGLLQGLFRREVPEVAQGAVEIKAIVREPGNRSKVAVASNQPGIDPVGSCVGQKGVRIQAIIAEFAGIEKIDIVQWQENPKEYVKQALSPAKNLVVEISEKDQTAKVKVATDELSLAIGKDGQNVRLASKLTGYRIEIEEDPTIPSIRKETIEEAKTKAVEEVVKVEEAQATPTEAVSPESAPEAVQAPELAQAAVEAAPVAPEDTQTVAAETAQTSPLDDSKMPPTDAQPETQDKPVGETTDIDETDQTNTPVENPEDKTQS